MNRTNEQRRERKERQKDICLMERINTIMMINYTT